MNDEIQAQLLKVRKHVREQMQDRYEDSYELEEAAMVGADAVIDMMEEVL